MAQSNVTEVEQVKFDRSPVGMAWRWRSEVGLLSSGAAGFLECWHCIGLDAAGLTFGGAVAAVAALPWSRSFAVRRFLCMVSRHRLQDAWWQLRLHNRAGRLPLVLWIRPTPVGERAWVFCRAGLCVDDFTKTTGEMAAACVARQVRVTGSRRFAPLVTIDVIRRDLLAPGRVIPSRLPAGPVPLPDWLALPDDPEFEPELIPDPERWPSTALPLDLEDRES
jgi:hypothetical protein